jgi:hypothetical protein
MQERLPLADERECSCALVRRNEPISATGDGELLAAEELADLASGVVGPWTVVVEPYIGLPVAQRGTMLAFALVSEGQIVVGVGIARGEGNGLAVGGNGLVRALEFVEDVAEIEVGQHVVRIGNGRAAVELFRARILA